MKALVGDVVVAEADMDSIVGVEGNAYFPPDSVAEGVLAESPRQYTCGWKGDAQYYDVLLDGSALADSAWSYPNLSQFAVERVGRDFAGYIAFDPRHVRFER